MRFGGDGNVDDCVINGNMGHRGSDALPLHGHRWRDALLSVARVFVRDGYWNV